MRPGNSPKLLSLTRTSFNQFGAGTHGSMQGNDYQKNGPSDSTLSSPYHFDCNAFVAYNDNFIIPHRQFNCGLSHTELGTILQNLDQIMPMAQLSCQDCPSIYLHSFTNNHTPSSSPATILVEQLAIQAEYTSPLTSSPSSNPESPRTKSHSCPSCSLAFTRLSDLRRHFSNIHVRIRHHCLLTGCGNNGGKGYCRKEKLLKHMKEKHQYL